LGDSDGADKGDEEMTEIDALNEFLAAKIMLAQAYPAISAALARQIPRPPRDADTMWVCPECTAAISPNDCYCSRCGQKIKWEEEK